ncbi:MAG: isoprenylcysteine carboxylmethyltransferase family protein [Thermomicrobiales bacterium]
MPGYIADHRPALVTWVASLIIWRLLEAGVDIWTFRRLRSGSRGQDKGSRLVLLCLIVLGLLVGVLVALKVPATAITKLPAIAFWLGVTLMYAGMTLRLYAIVTLGAAFTTTLAVAPEQTVIDTGPYRHIRHPSYTGLLLIVLGFGLSLTNWLSPLIIMGCALLGFAYRIRVEERVLQERLGRRYRDYMRRTKRLIPYVPCALQPGLMRGCALPLPQSSLDRPRRDLRPRAEAQFPENIAHMHLGGALGDHQVLGDFAARLPLHDQRRHLAFARRQPAERAPGRLAPRDRALPRQRRQRRAPELLAQGRVVERRRQLLDQLPRRRERLPRVVVAPEPLVCPPQRSLNPPQVGPTPPLQRPGAALLRALLPLPGARARVASSPCNFSSSGIAASPAREPGAEANPAAPRSAALRRPRPARAPTLPRPAPAPLRHRARPVARAA